MCICKECGKPCNLIEVDFGHGWSEHFGQIAFHENIQTVSDCCEAEYEEEE
jgi:hypothetical protein